MIYNLKITSNQIDNIASILSYYENVVLVADMYSLSRCEADELKETLLESNKESLLKDGVIKEVTYKQTVDPYRANSLKVERTEDDPGMKKYLIYGKLDQTGWVDFRVASNGQLIDYEVLGGGEIKMIYSFIDKPSDSVLKEFGLRIEKYNESKK